MTTISVVLVTGGWRGDSSGLVSVEVLHTNGSRICSLPDLPFKRVYHSQTGGTLCGGWHNPAKKSCHTLTRRGSWEKSHILSRRGRVCHSAWASPQGTILLGGEHLPLSNTTEILLGDGSRGTSPGFSLDYHTQ